MAKTNHVQTNFTAGELSPRLRGRTDFDKYFNGAEALENCLVHAHGGVAHRPGTRFVEEVKTSAKFTRLIPFEFSTTQTYVLEFGDLYFRVYRDGGQVENGGSPVEVVTPYTDADLPQIKFTQSADVLYLDHPDFPPKEVQRTSDIAWAITNHAFSDGPFNVVNVDAAKTIAPSATTGNGITLTAAGHTPFASTDADAPGRLIRIKHSTTWGVAQITAFTNSTVVTADVKKDFGATSASADWRAGQWSGTTGWPQVPSFHGGRLWHGANTKFPQTLWGSKSGDFAAHDPSDVDGTVTDAHGINITIDDDQVNAVRWLSSATKGLLIGSSGAEVLLRSSSTAKGITPNTAEIQRQTVYGSTINVRVIRTGRSVLFVQRGRKKVRELFFDFADTDGFVARDLTILSEHITGAGVSDMAFQQDPDNILWLVRDDGQLLGFTFQREQEVFAWHRHIIGGSFGGGDAVVESVAVIPEGDVDELWLIVKRTIDSATKRYVERMATQFDERTALEDAYFVDSGLSYDGAATNTFTGLEHLNGESLAVLADGSIRSNVTVASGSVTIDGPAASKAHIGEYRNANLFTLPAENPQTIATTRGRVKRMEKAHVLFWRTVGALVGPDSAHLDRIAWRSPSDPMDEPPPLFTGIKNMLTDSAHGQDIQVYVRQSQPLPFTVLSIIDNWAFHGPD